MQYKFYQCTQYDNLDESLHCLIDSLFIYLSLLDIRLKQVVGAPVKNIEH